MSASPYTKNSPDIDTQTTYVSYMSSMFKPITSDLRWSALLMCLLFHWILLSVVFGMIPLSRMLRKVWFNDVFVFLSKEILFYGTLFALYRLGYICVPEKLFVQY